jgi:hypothetical protein
MYNCYASLVETMMKLERKQLGEDDAIDLDKKHVSRLRTKIQAINAKRVASRGNNFSLFFHQITQDHARPGI